MSKPIHEHMFSVNKQQKARKFVENLNVQINDPNVDRCVLFSNRLDYNKKLIVDIYNKDQNGVSYPLYTSQSAYRANYPTFGCKNPCKTFNDKFGDKYVICEESDLTKHNVKVEK